MRFEWDEQKNQVNIRKHHLDFADAWELFTKPMLVALGDRMAYGEERWVGIGLLRTRIVVIVYVERDKDIIRVISLRKALTYEREQYEEFLADQLGKT